MGAVHGVYLKYVGLTALSYAGFSSLMRSADLGAQSQMTYEMNSLGAMVPAVSTWLSNWKLVSASLLGYSTLVNGLISVLFRLEWGMGVIGKDPKTGQIPTWSYVIFFPFHLPTMLYTHVHTRHGLNKADSRNVVPVASEVQPGFWVGGWYSHELNRDWGGVIDLTVEFPEKCISRTDSYLLLMTWDGVPATPDQLEQASNFAIAARKKGDVLVHCAHGRGRSTTVMCACLVKAGLFDTWEAAFEKGIKPGRPVCKLNSKMRRALAQWQKLYVDDRKRS